MSTKKSSPRSAKKKEALPPAPKQMRSHGKHVLHHHAHVIEHTENDIPLKERVETSGFAPEDIHEFLFPEGGVDEVRMLSERVYLRPRGDAALYVVTCATFTPQAQNALLKLLEDPPEHAVIVLGVAAPRTLLETIRSRVHILHDGALSAAPLLQPETLLDATLPTRLLLIEPLIELKDIDAACACVESVLALIHTRYADDYEILLDQTRSAAQTCAYLRMQGAMTKMLLEAWVLTLPLTAKAS
jgi:hypothetical protein